eukprot:TRINITY_DN10395_c0_g1_i1.p1 TRINITY_DN10395_c0_g1~~TRINITY_DN10395_c0_g1_i1.p1  ORF type:complete len:174 (-),score=16.25 TRINITY_DN10395_c0_g1_i1:118-639(-)
MRTLLEHSTFGNRRNIGKHLAKRIFDASAHIHSSHIVQSLLALSSGSERSFIIKKIADHAIELSKHEYGNFVVQKAIEHGSDSDRKNIIQGILVDKSAGHIPPLVDMMTNEFSHLIVLSLLQNCNKIERVAIIRHISDYKDYLTSQWSAAEPQTIVKFRCFSQHLNAIVSQNT